VRLEGLGQLKKIHLVGTRTRDLPACSIVPQPTTLPRTVLKTVRGIRERTRRFVACTTLSEAYREDIASNGRMLDELERIWKEAAVT
jgi:hypothetical protein